MKNTVQAKMLSVVAVLIFLFAVLAGCGGGGGGSSSPTPAKKVPSAPASVWVKSGVTEAEIGFSTPASDGGSPITSYTVVSSTGQTVSGTESPITVTGLPLIEGYTFTVYANNANGAGDPSTSSIVVPTATGSMPFMEKDGGSYFSVVQRPDGGYFCQCGDQKREVKIFSDTTLYIFKFFVDTDFAFVFIIKEAALGEDILMIKINKSDFSFTTKTLLANVNSDCISRFAKEPVFQILYLEGSRQYLKEIDLDGSDIRIIPLWANYHFDTIAVTATKVYMAGTITQSGLRNRICVKQFDRNYVDLGDSQQRPFDVNNETDFITGFSVDQDRGILISANLGVSDGTRKRILFFMDFATGTYTQIYELDEGGINSPFYDSKGNVYFTTSGIQFLFYKITPDGKVFRRGGLRYNIYPSQIRFEGDNVILLYNNPYNADDAVRFAPAKMQIFSMSTGWTQVN